MQLVEQALIDLDGPAATVRHLLTHTAGIREVLHPWAWSGPCSARR
jgi:CubicO group peptidase (beta-lactamase class C family)